MALPLRTAFRTSLAPLRRNAALAPPLARGSDPEEHVFEEGDAENNVPRKSVVKFRLATNSWNPRTNEEDTLWHNVESSKDYLNSRILKKVHVGALVYVDGSLKAKSYTDQNQIERQVYSVRVGSFTTLANSRRFDQEEEPTGEQK